MDKKSFFPMFIDLNDKECLVVGGGNIALRKTKTLLEYGAKVRVISPHVKHEFMDLDIELKKNYFCESDLEKPFLVIAATDNEELNLKIVELCNEKNILVNNITSKLNMSARFAAILENDDYQVAISAKGNPKKALKLKKEIENSIFNVVNSK
ncbi:MAG: bifunctional precorrin-2 dehydrogenase/sirohydrochlorin ferrochelatase [Cetobacterium sp.]